MISVPETDVKSLSKILTRKTQYRKPATCDRLPVNAIDTETSEGDIFLICDSDGRFCDKISPDTILDFLFNTKYQNAWNFCYNLEYDADVILKVLGNELFSYKKTGSLSFEYGEYRLDYMPRKNLRISKGHHSISLYDVAQFFQSRLVDAYQRNVGPVEKQYLVLKGKRNEFSLRFYRRHTNAVREYCINDCVMTKALAERWISLFNKAFNIYPRRWLSAGYLAEKVLITKGIAFPLFSSIPYEVQDLAYRSYFGGRFEMLKRGFIGTGYLYDVNSAYPDKIAKLPDLTRGEWICSLKIEPKAKIGFFKILANIPDDKYLCPFPFRANHTLVFPSGKFVTYCTIDELRVCENPQFYKILYSWQFVPEDPYYYPYQKEIEALYDKRKKLKQQNDPLELPIKLVLNSFYGKTGEVIRRKGARLMGNLFNPVVFAHITGSTRAQCYRFVIQNDLEKEVVGIATDSICCTRDLHISNSKIGDFSFKKSADDVFYLQNGIYRFNGEWSQRGLGKVKGTTIEHLQTFEKNGRLYMRLCVTRSTHLRSAIIQSRLEDIGVIKPVIREINPNADRKRLWIGRIKAIDSCPFNDSMSLSLNHFDKCEI